MGRACCGAGASDAGYVNLDIEGYCQVHKIAGLGINLCHGFCVAVALFDFGIFKSSADCKGRTRWN